MHRKSLLYTLSFVAGAALTLAFAPFAIYALAFISPALLLFVWLRLAKKPIPAMIAGFSFGIGFFATSVSWVFVSIYTYGHAPTWLAILITGLLVSVLALFPAVQGLALSKLLSKDHLIKNLFLFPSSWVLLEWIRSWFCGGFPWMFLGYTQLHTPLKNLAPLFGVYGISFAIAFTSVGLVYLILTKKILPKILILFTLLLLWGSCLFLGTKQWTEQQNTMLRVSLIQGNIPLEMKWSASQIKNILNNYYQLSSEHWNSPIIIWPEGAIPATQLQVPKYLKSVAAVAAKHNTDIVSGIIYQKPNTDQFYNAIITLGKNKSLYLKKHLVPFGEYFPLKKLTIWILNFMNMPWSDFTRGPKFQPIFRADNLKIAPFLCYEISYPNLALQYLPQAQLLLTISEDSWFGKSLAAAQQLEIAQIRSLETGRYQLVCANSGFTAIIDPKGQIIAKAPAFQQAVVSGDIYPMTGATPWVNYGHYLWLVLVLSLFVIGLSF